MRAWRSTRRMMTRTRWGRLLGIGVSMVTLLTVPVWATTTESLVSPVGAHFPQNKQNESPMAVNPIDPNNAISGANDEIEQPDCTLTASGSSSCPFDPFTQGTGVYVTANGGATWTHQILHWEGVGLRSDGDPAVAFGPKPNPTGGFSYASGARAYFASLAGILGSPHAATPVFVAVAHSDDRGSTWSGPVVATTRDNPVNFNDKVAVWADSNPSSPFFGNVYVSWTLFTGVTEVAEPIMVSRSTDGGQTFDLPRKLTPSHNNATNGGRQGSTVRTASNGDVFVFWEDSVPGQSVILGARSTNGGVTFDRPFLVAPLSDVPSPFPGASFRTDSFPMADIDGADLFVAWTTSSSGHSVVRLAKSTNFGATWSVSTVADVPGRSAYYPGVAARAGKVFIGFNAIDDKPAGTRPGAGVVSYDAYYALSTNGGASFADPVKISAASSDPDASSTNSLRAQFLGDYNGAAAGPDGAFWFSWTDTRNGSPCAAIDAWRASGFTTPKPDIYDACPATFGNTNIFVAKVVP